MIADAILDPINFVLLEKYSPQGAAERIEFEYGTDIIFNNTTNNVGRFFNTTGNFILQSGGTFTDAGYRLDVQGQARVTGNSFLGAAFINTLSGSARAILQADSTNRGFLPPRMTNAQRLAIASPAVGLIVYCTDSVEGLYINKSTGWTFII